MATTITSDSKNLSSLAFHYRLTEVVLWESRAQSETWNAFLSSLILRLQLLGLRICVYMSLFL